MTVEMIETLHPAGKQGTRVNKPTYDAFRKAILKAVPRTKAGVAFKDLPGLVEKRLPPEMREKQVKCGWWTTTVKLDLEARGLVERVEGKTPQHLRRPREGLIFRRGTGDRAVPRGG